MPREHARELVEVTYFPVHKGQALGRRMTRTIAARRGENPFMAAERALARRYKVRDFLIFDAHLAEPHLAGPNARAARHG